MRNDQTVLDTSVTNHAHHTHTHTHTNKRKTFFLLIGTIVIMLIVGELFFRWYYWHKGIRLGVDDNERCLKEMKLDDLPTAKNGNFINFTRQGYWQDDPVIGIIPKVNYTAEDIIADTIIQGKKKKLVFYSEHHHNSQSLTNVEEFSLEKPRDVHLRIALFGDSFTCGGEGPLLFNMGYVLKALIPHSEVMNFCVGGRGIETMYPRYVIEAKKYRPDIVIFNVYIDDLQRAVGCPIIMPNLTIADHHVIIGPEEYPTNKYFYYHYQLPRFESYFLKHALYVYNKYTGYRRNTEKGFQLFNVMLDDVKQQTRENNASFFVTLIQRPHPSTVDLEYYDKIINLLKEKNILGFNSAAYFDLKKNEYKNQSFYFITTQKPLGHYSPIGNALHAQGMKNLLEIAGLINKTEEYHFANYGRTQSLYIIPPETIDASRINEARALRPFEIKDANYPSNNLLTVQVIDDVKIAFRDQQNKLREYT